MNQTGKIYKIVNKINNKVYVGKTLNSLDHRFQQHCKAAKNGTSKLSLHRAMRKYGIEHFQIVELESCTSININAKERFWIRKLKSTDNKFGYNLTDGGDGGNTYRHKTDSELFEIKEKIRQTKLGDLNPHHHSFKAKNVDTGEEIIFKTARECCEYFNEKSAIFAIKRIHDKQTGRFLYKNHWVFADLDEEFPTQFVRRKQIARSNPIEIIDSDNNIYLYQSLTQAEQELNLPRNILYRKKVKFGCEFTLDSYKVKILNKCVSTICDECSRVGSEISTDSKREATEVVEDIVSTSSDA